MVLYKTVLERGIAEQVIEKSRFIGHVCPVSSKEEADVFFAQIKAQHKTATHNVPAFVIGDQFQLQWASDDGEPQGTSGAPMVQMIVKEGITNIAVVITRYFGGIKLGTGGLVRAYTSTAKLAIEAAGICHVQQMAVLVFEVDYSFHGKLLNLAENGNFTLRNTQFTDKVLLEVATEQEKTQEVISLFNNITSGSCKLLEEKEELVHIPL